MTCIAGIVAEDGAVYMAGDSAGSSGSGDQIIIATPKVFMRDDFVFGYAGEFRFGQVLQYHLRLPVYRGGEPTAFMVEAFVPALRKACHVAGFLGRNDEGRELGGWGIVGFRSRLYRIQEGFDILETIDGIDAIGTGGPYAIGVLQANRYRPDYVERLTEAMAITERYCSVVRGPFQYVKLENGANVKTRRRGRNTRRPRRV